MTVTLQRLSRETCTQFSSGDVVVVPSVEVVISEVVDVVAVVISAVVVVPAVVVVTQ